MQYMIELLRFNFDFYAPGPALTKKGHTGICKCL